MTAVFQTRRQKADPCAAHTGTSLASAMTALPLPPDWLTKARAAFARNTAENLPHPPKLRPRLSPETLTLSEARRVGTSVINPLNEPPDPRLVRRLGYALCLKHRVLPWRSVAGRITVLAVNVETFEAMRDVLTAQFGTVHLALVTPDKMDLALSRVCHKTLMINAEQRTAADESCRGWDAKIAARWGAGMVIALGFCFALSPSLTFLVLCLIGLAALLLGTALKVAAAVFHLTRRQEPPVLGPAPRHLPVVTLFVPLFRERDIAGALVRRLSRIDYPTDKLDVCLILEADDATTQSALSATDLPLWMRAIRVPLGTLQTKPRALNYALSFAKGEIIGVYDAEDAPDPDQIHRVVQRFATAPDDVACLQGRLDFYNSKSNWLARCFTVEYATWFRIMLPGLERMGLVIPLGGTTLFFRRDLIEQLGGWDAHNVTEDADLGIRLARHGYRTEIIDTTTQEEANARAWPWVKQRSRWLKGYAITYGVHMRRPRQLLRDLGLWRFLGVQVLFGGTILSFLLAPVLWSFWLMLVGLPHPLDGMISRQAGIALAATFLATEIIGVLVSGLAVTAVGKRDLVKWTPTLHVYFPLAVAAAYKGIYELATKPFYWDKTAHGVFKPTDAELDALAPPRNRDVLEFGAELGSGEQPTTPVRQLRHPIAAE